MDGQVIKQDSITTVKQHNALTEARYDMSPLQKNMFYLLLTQLKNESSLDELIRCKFKLSIKDINASRSIRVNKSELRQAARGLISSGLTLYDDSQKKLITIGILENADYGEGGDKDNLMIEFDPKLYPFLCNVKKRFTVFTLRNALNLKSKYSKRIYEMLCQFKNTGIFRISVQELKERFELIDSKTGKEVYLNFGEFARRILDSAKKEINEYTDISFDYTTKKTGRKVTNLEFEITTKEVVVVKELAKSSDKDLQVAMLKERLLTQFKLSKTLAKKVIENIPIEKIEAKNQKTWKDYEAGKIEDLGAYCTTVFQNWLDGAEPVLEKPNSPKHIALRPVQQRTQEADLEKENLTRLYGFGLEQKRVYILSVKYTSEQLRSAIRKVDEVLKKQEISQNPEQVHEMLIQELNNQVEPSNFSSTIRSGSLVVIDELTTQIEASSCPVQKKKSFSEEEKKKEWVIMKLYNDFRIDYAEVDLLTKKASLEDLTAAISKISQKLGDKKLPQHPHFIIQRLKKELNLG